MRNEPRSHYSPVKIPFKILHFTNKSKSQALQLQSYLTSSLPTPQFIACLRAGFQDAQSIGSTQRENSSS